MVALALILLAQVILPPFARIADLASNHDGTEVYFSSGLIHPETATPHSKIFRWTPDRGVQTYIARNREWTTPWYRNGILSNYYDLRFPSVAANGRISVTGYRDSQLGAALARPNLIAALVLQSDGTTAREIELSTSDLRLPLYRTVLSPNGLYFVVPGRSYYVEPRAAVVSLGRTAKRSVVADDGTAVYSGANFRLAAIGRYDPDNGRSTREQLLPASVPVMAPMISGNGKVVVYESLYEQGMQRRFFSLNLITGEERLLFTDAQTEDYGAPDFLSDRPLNSPVPTPEPMYGASIDHAGRYVLLLGREAVDKPRQWLYLAPTDRGEGGGEWFGYVEEGYSEAVISGDAEVIFAVTNSGRLIRIDRSSNLTEELLPRTPSVTNILGSVSPGSLVRVYGGGFATETKLPLTYPATTLLAGVEIEFQGRRLTVTRVSPTQIDLQIPWDFVLQPTNEFYESPLVVKVPSDSPLHLAPLKWIYDRSPSVLPPGPLREDGTPVTLARRVRSYETLRMTVSGLPLPAGLTGMPAAERKPIDFPCRAGNRPAETLYAGPLPGTVGLGELVVKLPDLTGTQNDAGRRWTTLRCGEPGQIIAVDLPVEKD
ncbi:MAG: hypothetical protein IT168_28215 [Bryobacterales bacterium]|nr:hypothetical protein [Bryobacterales bacterium]